MKRITIERLACTEGEKEVLKTAYAILQELDDETNGSEGCSLCPLAFDCPSSNCAIRRCREDLKKIINNV